MREVAFQLLWGCVLLPVGVALLLLPVSKRAPRGFVVVTVALAWLGSLASSVAAFAAQLERGGWSEWTTKGFVGASLGAWDFAGAVRLNADPLASLLSLGFAVGGGALLVGAMSASGGGPRSSAQPLSSGQLAGALLLYGLVEAAILWSTLDGALAAAMLASVVTWGLSSSADPKREQRDAAGHVFILHRVGDAAWTLALGLAFATFGSLDPRELASLIGPLSEWLRVPAGPLVGFPLGGVLSTTAALLFVGVASRIPLLPLPMLYRRATGMPAPALALAHGMGGFLLGLVVLLRTMMLWERAGLLVDVVLLLAASSAFVAAAAAAAARDITRIDLHLWHVLACFGVVAALLGERTAAVIAALALVVAAPALSSSTAVVLEALPGRSDPFEMGGLWRSLRMADRARAIGTFSVIALPPFALWLVVERALFEAVDGARGQPLVALLLVVSAAVVSFAAFRSLHLVFSGDAPRVESPADVVAPAPWRALLPLVVAIAGVLLAPVMTLPASLVAGYLDGYREPLLHFLIPTWATMEVVPLSGEASYSVGRQGLSETWRFLAMALVTAGGIAGFLASALLYRKGPTRVHDRLARAPVVARTAVLAETTLGLERAFLAWLPALVEQLARALVTVVLGALLDVVVTRAVALVGGALRTLIRFAHNGDVQRALFFGVLVAAAMLFAWGRG